MKKNYIVILAIISIILILGGGFLFWRSRRAQELPPTLEPEGVLIETTLEERPYITLTPSSDGHWLTIEVSRIREAENLENRVWGRMVGELVKRVSEPKSVLILGLGGGTEAKLLAERFPEILIDGVELDPVIVEVGKRFFDLDKIPNLQVITADAVEVVKTPKNHPLRASQYSIVIVDTYIGDNTPPALEEPGMITGIKKLLSPEGVAVFNRLSKLVTHEFRAKLKDIFGNVEEVGVTYGWGLPPGNTLFFCS